MSQATIDVEVAVSVDGTTIGQATYAVPIRLTGELDAGTSRVNLNADTTDLATRIKQAIDRAGVGLLRSA